VIGLASAVVLIGALALWINRVALDNDTYTDTSAKVLQQPEVQHALSVYLVDQLYANVDVPAAVAQRLPPNAQPLAGPIAGFLRDYAERAAQRMLESERIQQLWIRANRAAHANLVLVIGEGTGSRGHFTTTNGDVVLNLGPMVQGLAERLAVDPGTISGGRVVILHSDQLSTAQSLVHLLDSLVWVLPVLALMLCACAIWLARGRRREAARALGIGILLAGIALVAIRRIGGEQIVGAITNLEPGSSAAQATWDVVTEGLADTATTLVAVGLLIIAWAWATGPGGRAGRIRQMIGPQAIGHPDRVWLAAGAAWLLVIYAGPTEAFRRVWPLAIMTVLGAAGIELLLRQSATEARSVQPHGESEA